MDSVDCKFHGHKKGIVQRHNDRFFNIPGGAYVDTRHKNFFGIDHVGVSVGYRIDWKGGRR